MNSYLRTRQVTSHRDVTNAGIASIARVATYVILISLAIYVCGCANTEIGAARAELTKGNYAAAHERFVAASHSPKLTARDRRELAGGLCLTEEKLGAPQYPLAEQRRTCANAAARAGSSSGPTLSSIDSAERIATNTAGEGA